MTKVILSWANRKDVEHDVAPEVRNEMEFVFVRTALEAAFGRGTLAWRGESMLLKFGEFALVVGFLGLG